MIRYISMVPVGTFAMLLQAPTLPPLLERVLSPEAIVATLAVMGMVSSVKQLFPELTGFAAVVLTIVFSLGFGILQYGLTPGSIGFGVVVGVAAAYAAMVSVRVGLMRMRTRPNGNEPSALPISFIRRLVYAVLYIIFGDKASGWLLNAR